MAWFDNLSKNVKNVGNKGVDKAKEIRDTSRIALDIKSQENLINKLYTDIGKKYYSEHKNDESPEYGQILEIRAAFAKIEELQDERDGIKGVIKCAGCGKVVSREAAFCPSCGAKITIPEPEEATGDVLDESGEVVDTAAAEEAAAAEAPAEEAAEASAAETAEEAAAPEAEDASAE